jgi:hypothetical protein
VRQLAAELQQQGHQVGRHKVAALLADLAYSLHRIRQTKEGTAHPDRNAQFAHLNAQVAACQKRGQPVVWVDPKKKALGGISRTGAAPGAHTAPRNWCVPLIVPTKPWGR